MMKMFRKKEEGFTLVELMVVVLIIGILVAIAIPVFNAAKANSEEKSCYANQRTIEGANSTYQADTGVLLTNNLVDSSVLITGGYVKKTNSSNAGPQCKTAAAVSPGAPAGYSLDDSGTIDGDQDAATFVTGHEHFK